MVWGWHTRERERERERESAPLISTCLTIDSCLVPVLHRANLSSKIIQICFSSSHCLLRFLSMFHGGTRHNHSFKSSSKLLTRVCWVRFLDPITDHLKVRKSWRLLDSQCHSLWNSYMSPSPLYLAACAHGKPLADLLMSLLRAPYIPLPGISRGPLCFGTSWSRAPCTIRWHNINTRHPSLAPRNSRGSPGVLVPRDFTSYNQNSKFV